MCRRNTLLFHASIRENLLWACDGATEDHLWEALRLANADDFVRELPRVLIRSSVTAAFAFPAANVSASPWPGRFCVSRSC
jgi:ABC-type transport system involved in Fe-S cluster assembly fused permease/ATPase subunit